MRKVHDILYGRSGKHEIVIAFIQHGNTEDGYSYENVCPWCSMTIEKVTANPQAEMSAVANRLREGVARHIWTCTHRNSFQLQVEKTSVPLDTSKRVKEQ